MEWCWVKGVRERGGEMGVWEVMEGGGGFRRRGGGFGRCWWEGRGLGKRVREEGWREGVWEG